MNTLASLFNPDHIVIDLEASSKKRLFEQAGLLFENLDGLPRARVYDSLFARERAGSTGLGQGVAIPHGRIKGVRSPVGAVMRLKTPIPFESPDAMPVSLAIVLMVPERATSRHLDILSQLAELLSDRTLRTQIQTETDPDAIHQLIATWQPHVADQRSAAR